MFLFWDLLGFSSLCFLFRCVYIYPNILHSFSDYNPCFFLSFLFFFFFTRQPKCEHNPILGESCTLCVCRSSHTVLSRALLCFPLFRHCMSRKSFTFHLQTRVPSESKDWLHPITFCHPVMLPVVFFVGFSVLQSQHCLSLQCDQQCII